jgi:hypothetical protein
VAGLGAVATTGATHQQTWTSGACEACERHMAATCCCFFLRLLARWATIGSAAGPGSVCYAAGQGATRYPCVCA